jgi:DNA polymerase-1
MGAGNQGRKLCLVDGNSYIHRAFHAVRDLRTSRGIPTNAVYGFLAMIIRVLKEEKPDLVAVVFDSPGPTFRHRLYPEYKANRPTMPDDLAVQVDYVHRLTAAFGLTVVAREGVEADDLIATLARRGEGEGLEVVLVSGDKDLQQLLGERVSLLDTMKERVVTARSFSQEHGLPPARFADVQALSGDASDNIPGVRGIGPKTAERLVAEFGGLEELYGRLDRVPPGRTRQLLEEGRDAAFTSLALARLRDDLPLEIRWEELASFQPDRRTLRALLEELEFRKLLRELDLEDGPRDAGAVAAEELPLDRFLAEAGRQPVAVACAGDGEGTLLALAAPGAGTAVVAGDGGDGDLARVREFLEDPATGVWGYDLKAVLKRLRRLAITPARLEMDILLGAYLLDPSGKETTLAELAAARLGGRREEAAPGERQGILFADGGALRKKAAGEAATVAALGGVIGRELADAGMDGLYREMELPLIRVLDRMEETGIGLDAQVLRDLSKEIAIKLQGMEEEIHRLAGQPFNIASPRQLAEILFVKLGLPPVKKTKTGFSTDEEVLVALAARHELPSLLVSHRQLSKLRNTYVDVLPSLVGADGRVHTTFNQAVTATGRLSSSGPNLQNIPIRTEWGRRIREAFVPRPGWKLISADYSQIELRILAHLSGDETLGEAFRRREDIHARTAAEIFHVHPGLVTKEMRRAAKTINFGIIYGMSPYGLSRELSIDQREAKAYIDGYFTAYRGVKTYLDGLVAEARRTGYVATLFGRRRHLPELRSGKPQLVQFAERAALNTPIQGTAADLIKLAMLKVDRELAEGGRRARMLLQIHDELLVEAPPEEVEEVSSLLRRLMEGAASFSVPIVADLAVGDSWGRLDEVEEG